MADGWRDFRETGGLVMDLVSNEVVADGLSMPHSPRLHDGRLWLLNSGTGHLGFVDVERGQFEPVTFVPGYARGLVFHGDYAFVGLSKPRREHAFHGLPLEKNLADRGAAPRCGLQVIELKSGAVLHWARIESAIEELFDIALLPGVVRPKSLSFTSSTYPHQLTFLHQGRLQRWTAVPEQGPSSASSPDATRRDSAPRDIMAPRRTPRNTAQALNNLGLSHCAKGQLDQARQCFERAVSLDPQHAGALNNLGNIFYQQRQWKQAVECYRQALQADPNYARAFLNLGQTLVALGRLPEAGGCFRRALDIDPHYLEAGVALGTVLKDQGKLDDALRCFQQAIQLSPTSWTAHHGLGQVHEEREEYEPALVCYEQALRIEPQLAEAWTCKGSVLRKLGREDEARVCTDRAREIDAQADPQSEGETAIGGQ